MASIAVSLGSQALRLVGGLFAQHTARLRGAQEENAAVPDIVAAFDADVTELIGGFNNGEISTGDALQAVQQIDQQVYSYLRGLAGKPGTAWRDFPDGHPICDKTCTVGCCLYWAYLHQGLVAISQKISSGSGTFNAATIPPNKYGFPGRQGYSIPIQKSSGVASVEGTLLGSVKQVLAGIGFGPQAGTAATSSLFPQRGSLTLLYIGLGFVFLLVLFLPSSKR